MVVLSAVDDHRQEVLWEHLTLREGGVPFSIDELESAIKSLKAGKALGPDGVENLGVKAAYHTDPSGLLNVYNSCKAEGVFPSKWKVVQLILLEGKQAVGLALIIYTGMPYRLPRESSRETNH